MSFNSKLGDYIVVAKDVIPHELCDRIIQEYNDSAEYEPATVDKGETNAKIRRVDKVCLSYENVISVNRSVRSSLDAEIYKASEIAIKAYRAKHWRFDPENDTGYELLRYKTGDFYTEHTDSYKEHPRSISCSFALNEDYEGGHFGFFGREVTVKAPKGAAVMFPSNFMFPHEIMPVVSGTRYSIITWFI